MTPMPSAASSPMIACTSALEPTSTPRVGSSRIRIDGIGVEPLAQHHLLLIAARKLGDGDVDRRRADREPRAESVGGPALQAGANEAERD